MMVTVSQIKRIPRKWSEQIWPSWGQSSPAHHAGGGQLASLAPHHPRSPLQGKEHIAALKSIKLSPRPNIIKLIFFIQCNSFSTVGNWHVCKVQIIEYFKGSCLKTRGGTFNHHLFNAYEIQSQKMRLKHISHFYVDSLYIPIYIKDSWSL